LLLSCNSLLAALVTYFGCSTGTEAGLVIFTSGSFFVGRIGLLDYLPGVLILSGYFTSGS
jgi:hypothetical protein